jgi:ADP-ribose pyrophosphatase
MAGFCHLGDTDVHQGHVWKVVLADFEAPSGERFRRDIVRSPGSVGVVPLVFDAEGLPSVVLVSQYRPPYERSIIELPAGMRDVPGEPADVTGRRELIEEAGLEAAEMVHLIDMYPSPGMTDSICSIFLATGCTPVPHDRHGPEEHEMELLHLPLDDALAMIDRGEISDAKTVVGLFATDRRLRG